MFVKIHLSIVKGDNIDNKIFFNIDDLKNYWDDLINYDQSAIGVIHLGYSTPNYTSLIQSRVYKKLKKKIPTSIIYLTAPARWGLPSDYTITSIYPIGFCQSSHHEDCPVYLSLNGWGYIFDKLDFLPQINQLKAIKDNLQKLKAPIEPLGWIKVLANFHPEQFEVLKNEIIYTDDEYIQDYYMLDDYTLERMDRFRKSIFEKMVNNNNLEDIMKNCPNWLLNLNFSDIEISERVRNVFVAESIEYIKDLSDFKETGLLKLANFGRTSIKDLKSSIINSFSNYKKFGGKYLEHCNVDEYFKVTEESITTLKNNFEDVNQNELNLYENISQALDALTEKESSIFKDRIGWYGQVYTLEAIGKKHGLTRERVRQIQRKTMSKFKENGFEVNFGILSNLLLDSERPLYLDMLDVNSDYFVGFENNLELLGNVISNFTDLNVIEIEGRPLATYLSQESFEGLISSIELQIKDYSKNEVTKNIILDIIEDEFIGRQANELRSTTINIILSNCHFFQRDEKYILSSYGRKTAESLVKIILNESNKPMHYEHIHQEILNRSLINEIDIRRVHSALCTMQEALQFSRGVYGIEKHIPLSNEKCKEILEHSEEIIINGELDKQWHLSELLNLLLEEYKVPSQLTVYILRIILLKSDLLSDLGRMTWQAKISKKLSTKDRVQMFDLFINILKEEGCPLDSKDLKNKAMKIRGLNSSIQIHPKKPLIKITERKWGLVPRDIPISEFELKVFIDKLYYTLYENQEGIHFSEIKSILNSNLIETDDFNYYIFLNLCKYDSKSRFYIGQGGLIGLSEWKSTRRYTKIKAIEKAFEDIHDNFTLIQFQNEIERKLKRSIEASTISAWLNEEIAVYNKENNTWSKLA